MLGASETIGVDAVTDHEAHIANLQTRLREQLDALDALPSGGPAYAQAAETALRATHELLDYEERLPELIEAPRRRLSLLAVRWAGLSGIAVAVGLATAMIPGWVARPWLIILLPMLVLGTRLEWLPVEPSGGTHLEQRWAGVAFAIGCLAAVLVVTGLVPWWLIAPVGVAILGSAAYLLRRTVFEPAPEPPPTRVLEVQSAADDETGYEPSSYRGTGPP